MIDRQDHAGRRATLIGGSGFIGRHLHARLNETGWQCRVYGNGDAIDMDGDLGAVFYCAGLTADYAVRPFDTVQAHVEMLRRVLQFGRFDALVYLSSTRLYDSQPGLQASEDVPLLLDPNNPRHIYDLSKALGESLCRVAGGGRARVARLSCVVRDHTDTDGFLPALLRRVVAHGGPAALSVDSSPEYSRDYVLMDDVIDALIHIVTAGTQTIYNVAGGENVSNRQLFETITAASGCALAPSSVATAPPPPHISIQRMRDEFAWQPAAILQRVAQWIGATHHA